MNSVSTDPCGHPLVSVCVPSVNRLRYLEECLTSVVGQTARDWELVVGENSGGPEYGAEVDRLVSRLTSELPNLVRVIHQDTQLSMVGHANALMGAANGNYVLYLPDDDRLRAECLERLTAPLRTDPTVDLVFSDSWIIRSDGSIDRRASEAMSAHHGRSVLQAGRVPPGDLIALALRQSFMLQAMLLRKTVLEQNPFRVEMERLPDHDLQLRLTQRQPALSAFYCPDRLVEYRIHAQQATSGGGSIRERSEFHRACLASLLACDTVPGEHRRLYRRKIAEQRAGLASCQAASRDWRNWWTTAVYVIHDDPRWAGGYRGLLRPFIPGGLIEPARRVLQILGRVRDRGSRVRKNLSEAAARNHRQSQ